jgi:hypothetical protein
MGTHEGKLKGRKNNFFFEKYSGKSLVERIILRTFALANERMQ